MGRPISALTETGSAPSDSYLALAYGGGNYKISPSGLPGTTYGAGMIQRLTPVIEPLVGGYSYTYTLPEGGRTVFEWAYKVAPGGHDSLQLFKVTVDEASQAYAAISYNGYGTTTNQTSTSIGSISTSSLVAIGAMSSSTISMSGDGGTQLYVHAGSVQPFLAINW